MFEKKFNIKMSLKYNYFSADKNEYKNFYLDYVENNILNFLLKA